MEQTPRERRERRLAHVRHDGLSLVTRGEILAWLGGLDNGADKGRRNTDGDFVIGNELPREDYDDLGPATRQWLGAGSDGDRVGAVIDTARGWGVLTLQLRYVESQLWIPRDPLTLTSEKAGGFLPSPVRPGESLGAPLGWWTREGGFPNQTLDKMRASVLPGHDGRIDWCAWAPPGAMWSFVTLDVAVETLGAALRATV